MTSNNCETRTCEPCGPDEYQETYTTENKCEPQPYCDPSKTFAHFTHICIFFHCMSFKSVTLFLSDKNKYTGVHDSTKKAVCLCKQGFHCSSEYCETCSPHKQCGPGEGVESKGATEIFKLRYFL